MSYIDNFSAESILVIKKPPTSSPTIKPITLPTQNNFLEERFVCFAYRYEYQNGSFQQHHNLVILHLPLNHIRLVMIAF